MHPSSFHPHSRTTPHSNGTPNLQNQVEKWGLQPTRVLDAQAARACLATDSHIDSTRVGLLGWSHGAQAAMVEAAEKPTNTLFRIGTQDDFFFNCQSRATTAQSTYGSTQGSGHELVFVSYADAEHGFDGESQTWPTSTTTCSTPDTCAMKDADLDSLAFLLSRL